jgi:uncharacterized protein YdaU (DUF1376 family)
VNYYEHHLGDYVEATAHLSMIEDGAYSRLLRKYYATERPLPRDLKDVQRLVLCRSAPERKAVEMVLGEFFELREDGWHQERCDREIERYHERVAQQRAASALGVKARLSGTPSGKSKGTPFGDQPVNGRLTPPVSSLQSPSTNPQSPHSNPIPEGGVEIVGFGTGPGKKRFRTADEIEAEERARASQ